MRFINILIFSLILFSCNKNGSSETKVQKDTTSSRLSSNAQDKESLELGKLSLVNFGEKLVVTGMIDVPPKNKAAISTFIGGYIVNTPLLVGDKVSKGQLLVSLENPEYVELQQDYLELSEQLIYLKSEYNRQKTLFEENISSEKSYLKAQSSYKSTLAHFTGLKKKLKMLNLNPQQVEAGKIVSRINLYAPMEGYITNVNVSNGVYVSAQDVILEIVDTDHIHLELSVFEKDVMKVSKGQDIQFQIPEATTEIFSGEVYLVGTTIDEKTRRVKVHGHVDNETNQFIVGMYVTAEIFLSDQMAPGLPKTAIVRSAEGDYVVALVKSADGQPSYKKIKVALGKQNENYTEIQNSEALKDHLIIIKGAETLLD